MLQAAPSRRRPYDVRRPFALHIRRTVALTVIALACLLPLGSPSLVAQVAPALPRGPWVPSWTVLYGGFVQVDDVSFARPDLAWGIDTTVVTASGPRRGQTAFVLYDGKVWRSAQIEDNVQMSVWRWPARTWAWRSA